jgi:hypothetical protein
VPKSFPEATLYALLRALFGRPTGFMSLAIHPQGDPDAPFKYEYFLDLPDGLTLSIVRSWLNLEVRAHGRKISSEEVVKMFTYNFDIHKTEVSECFDKLEVYRLIINPHARHKRIMRDFESQLKPLKMREPDYPRTLVCSKAEQKSWNKQLKAYIKNAHAQNSLAVSLVMESAYSAESLLNLFIAVLKKPELDNPKFLQDALYEPWKEKLQRLPLHCNHIARPADIENAAVKSAERLFKRRNKIAHSYPDPDELCAAKIWFDDKRPILPNSGPYVGYQLGADVMLPTQQEALECPSLAEAFEEYLYSLLEKELEEEIRFFARSNPIGFSEKTRRYGIPFGETVSMVLFPRG